MAVGKEIRGKIKSVENTKKITKAMEMVAASKMRKAQERMRAARPYATKIRAEKDLVYHFDGLHVVVDQKSIEVLKGSTLDWERRLMGYGFKWINPNAKNDCGCGESFDVA